MSDTLFIIFGLGAVGLAISVVASRSPIYSVFSLILCLIDVACLYVLWGNPFLAVIQILVYTGAIVVLFVFAVMLLGLRREPSTKRSVSWFVVIASVTWAFSFLLLKVLNAAVPHRFETTHLSGTIETHTPSLRVVSRMLFTEYLWPFEILSVLLLAVIVAVYALARPKDMAQDDLMQQYPNKEKP